MTRDLVSNPCTGKCDWKPTGEQLDGEPLFACGGCASEWVPSQGWTPRNADGEVSPEVATAKALASGQTLVDEPGAEPGSGAGGGSVDSW